MTFAKYIYINFFSLITCFVFTFSAQAQRDKIDSILAILPAETIDEELDAVYGLTTYYMDVNLDTSLIYANQMLDLAVIHHKDSLASRALSLMGLIYDYKIETDSSRYFHNKAIQYSQLTNQKNAESVAYNNLAILEWNAQNFEATLENLQNALRIAEETGNKEMQGTSLGNIAVICLRMTQYRKAIDYCFKAIELNAEMNHELSDAESYHNMSLCYDKMGLLDSAKWALEQAFVEIDKFPDLRIEGLVYGAAGAVAFSEGKYDQALENTIRSYEINVELESISQVNNLVNLSVMYYAIGDYKKGIDIADEAQELIDAGYIVDNSKDVYLYRAINAAAMVNRDLTISSIQTYLEMIDSTYSEQTANAISELEVKYETEKQKRQLLIEKNKSAKQELELKNTNLRVANRNNWLILVVSIALLVIVISIYLSQKGKQRVQIEKARIIQDQQNQNTELLIELQENERKRIAKDLHDGVGQQLSGLRMSWSALLQEIDPLNQETINKMEVLTEQLSHSMEEVRAISHVMMPKTLQELGLVPALENLLDKTFRFAAINYRFEQHNATERYGEKIEICFYRIAQELINNCIKHADASNLSVQLIRSKKYLTMLVEDNGKGIEIDYKSGHGMANIETRIKAIGGDINYETNPEGGTIAIVRVMI